MIKDESHRKSNVFFSFPWNNVMKGKLLSTKSALWYSRCKIHRYVAAPQSNPQDMAMKKVEYLVVWLAKPRTAISSTVKDQE